VLQGLLKGGLLPSKRFAWHGVGVGVATKKTKAPPPPPPRPVVVFDPDAFFFLSLFFFCIFKVVWPFLSSLWEEDEHTFLGGHNMWSIREEDKEEEEEEEEENIVVVVHTRSVCVGRRVSLSLSFSVNGGISDDVSPLSFSAFLSLPPFPSFRVYIKP
jgi:hypothetical protein